MVLGTGGEVGYVNRQTFDRQKLTIPQVALSCMTSARLDIITSMLGSSSRKICKASGIQVNSCPVRKPMRSMASRDERPGVQLLLPLQPAIAPSGRVRERLALPVSVRCRERGVSRVAHLPRPQDLESADLVKVVTCAAFALLPPSDFHSHSYA